MSKCSDLATSYHWLDAGSHTAVNELMFVKQEWNSWYQSANASVTSLFCLN